MQIRESNWTFRLIQFFFSGYRPKDLCSFWWMSIVAWFTAFMSPPLLGALWMIQWWVPKRNRSEFRFPNEVPAFPIIICGALVIFAASHFAINLLEKTSIEIPVLVPIVSYVIATVGTSILAILIVILVRSIILIIDTLFNVICTIAGATSNLTKIKPPKSKSDSILMTRFRDWKDKTCTRIDYID